MQWASSLGITHQWHSALWWFRLPPQTSRFPSSSLTPIPLGCFLTANCSHLPRSALQTPHFSTQLFSSLVDMPLRLGGQGWGQYPVCRSHSVLLPHTVCHVLPTKNETLFLSKLSSPSEGLPRIWRPHFHLPAGLQAPTHFLSSSFSFFFLLSYPAEQESFLSFQISKGLC